jgi:HTH-type transcriptional regulator, sugar sensing transcriptional regulator
MISSEINLLNKIGLTDAEAKVYLALLSQGSMSGYEASKLSSVARSKIYNVLESLVSKGFILYAEQENNNKYAAVPIEEITQRVKRETDDVLENLTERLKEHSKKTDLEYIWHIHQNSNVFAKCREIIKNTKNELLVQIWEEDLPNLIEDLQELEKKDIRMGIVYFSNNEDSLVPLKKYCRHGLVEEKFKEMGGRWITLVSDMKEVVFGQILSNSIAEVIWTESKPMIALAAECVRHDLYFYKSADIFQEVMQKELGKDYEKIRDIF